MLDIKQVAEIKRIRIHMGKILVFHLCLKVDDAEQSQNKSQGLISRS